MDLDLKEVRSVQLEMAEEMAGLFMTADVIVLRNGNISLMS